MMQRFLSSLSKHMSMLRLSTAVLIVRRMTDVWSGFDFLTVDGDCGDGWDLRIDAISSAALQV